MRRLRRAPYVIAILTACSGKTLHLGHSAEVPTIDVAVSSSLDFAHGVNGHFEEAMSTSFQPADWQYQFFQRHPDESALDQLQPQHVLIQLINGGAVPWKKNGDWDFGELDAIVQPVLASQRSVELQIAVAPQPAIKTDGSGSIDSELFAQYCEHLVQYYNMGGFDWAGQHFAAPSGQAPITWWGIFNEYNVHQLTDGQYTQLYNTVVPRMLNVDRMIKFSALEFTDFNYSMDGNPRFHLPNFLMNVTAQVDVVSVHFYSTHNYTDPDTALFKSVGQFAGDLGYIYGQLKPTPNAEVWVTQNNVNSDYPLIDGTSANNQNQPFVPDPRGTSGFFAAWRPYVFSQLGKAGNRALYHWEYTAGHCAVTTSNCAALASPTDTDTQNAEVNFVTGEKYLSYWVDYWLGQMFPVTPTSVGPEILQFSTSAPDSSDVEVLATRNSDDRSVVVMVVDKAFHDPADRDGHGDPRAVVVDISALGPFRKAATLTIDANTDLTVGPTLQTLPVAPKMTLTLGGYGVAFLKLTP